MMTETSPPNEKQLLESIERLLADRLPGGWMARIERDPLREYRGQRFRPDGALTISTPIGDSVTFVVEAKLSLYPRDAYAMERQLGTWRPAAARSADRFEGARSTGGLLVASRFLTPRTRKILRGLGVSYADATGNLRLEAQEPPMLIELSGAATNPWVTKRPKQSLKGPGTARVVRALLDFAPPYTLRDLAQTGDLPLGTTSRVVSYLVEEALVTREGRGKIEDVDWQQLLRLWSRDYALLGSNEVETFLEPRGPMALAERLEDLDLEYVVTGSLAAARKIAFAPPALASVYVRNISRAAEALGLRPTPSGGNVLLISPDSGVAFERVWSDGPLRYAAITQVAADLLSSPGRAPSEAEALIEWMEDDEDAWRRS